MRVGSKRQASRSVARPAIRSAMACGAAAAVLATSGCAGVTAFGLDSRAVELTVSPGSGNVAPDSPVVVRATGGRLVNVTVSPDGGAPLAGDLAADGMSWQSRWPLEPGTQYQVRATGLGGDGRTHTVVQQFSTQKVKTAGDMTITAPDEGETVGVGMPVILHFPKKVKNRADVEQALEVRASRPVVGAWHWLDDTDVVFRTRDYWPAHTKVEVIGHLSGVKETATGYGSDFDRHFTVGDSHITVASSRNHHQVIYKNGKAIRTMPVSMGRGGEEKYTTTSGVHLTMEKSYLTVMTNPGVSPGSPGYYQEDVYWTVRISDSGEYEHSAPWSVGDQGYDNVSHGCVNLSPSNAIWFYRFTNRGDVVKITGTSRKLDPGNGWGFWQESWGDWLKWSALHQPVTAAALDGSSQVAPAVVVAPAPAASPTAHA